METEEHRPRNRTVVDELTEQRNALFKLEHELTTLTVKKQAIGEDLDEVYKSLILQKKQNRSYTNVKGEMILLNQRIEETKEAIKNISQKDLMELSTYNNPPLRIKLGLQALFLILQGELLNWPDIAKGLRSNFLGRIERFDWLTVAPTVWKTVRRDFFSHDEWSVEDMQKASAAAGPLIYWLESQHDYYAMVERSLPVKREMEELRGSRETLEEKGKTLEEEYDDLEECIAKLTDEIYMLKKSIKNLKDKGESAMGEYDRMGEVHNFLEALSGMGGGSLRERKKSSMKRLVVKKNTDLFRSDKQVDLTPEQLLTYQTEEDNRFRNDSINDEPDESEVKYSDQEVASKFNSVGLGTDKGGTVGSLTESGRFNKVDDRWSMRGNRERNFSEEGGVQKVRKTEGNDPERIEEESPVYSEGNEDDDEENSFELSKEEVSKTDSHKNHRKERNLKESSLNFSDEESNDNRKRNIKESSLNFSDEENDSDNKDNSESDKDYSGSLQLSDHESDFRGRKESSIQFSEKEGLGFSKVEDKQTPEMKPLKESSLQFSDKEIKNSFKTDSKQEIAKANLSSKKESNNHSRKDSHGTSGGGTITYKPFNPQNTDYNFEDSDSHLFANTESRKDSITSEFNQPREIVQNRVTSLRKNVREDKEAFTHTVDLGAFDVQPAMFLKQKETNVLTINERAQQDPFKNYIENKQNLLRVDDSVKTAKFKSHGEISQERFLRNSESNNPFDNTNTVEKEEEELLNTRDFNHVDTDINFYSNKDNGDNDNLSKGSDNEKQNVIAFNSNNLKKDLLENPSDNDTTPASEIKLKQSEISKRSNSNSRKNSTETPRSNPLNNENNVVDSKTDNMNDEGMIQDDITDFEYKYSDIGRGKKMSEYNVSDITGNDLKNNDFPSPQNKKQPIIKTITCVHRSQEDSMARLRISAGGVLGSKHDALAKSIQDFQNNQNESSISFHLDAKKNMEIKSHKNSGLFETEKSLAFELGMLRQYGESAIQQEDYDDAVKEILRMNSLARKNLKDVIKCSEIKMTEEDDYFEHLEAEKRKAEEELEEQMRIEVEREREEAEKERQRLIEEEKEKIRLIEEENERQRLVEEEKEKIRLIEEENERQRLIKEEEERLRLIKEEEERLRLIEEEKEKIRLIKEEEERLRLMKEEEERLRLIKEEEERLRLIKEEEERLRLIEEENERQRLVEEEEERLRLLEEEKLKKELEDKKIQEEANNENAFKQEFEFKFDSEIKSRNHSKINKQEKGDLPELKKSDLKKFKEESFNIKSPVTPESNSQNAFYKAYETDEKYSLISGLSDSNVNRHLTISNAQKPNSKDLIIDNSLNARRNKQHSQHISENSNSIFNENRLAVSPRHRHQNYSFKMGLEDSVRNARVPSYNLINNNPSSLLSVEIPRSKTQVDKGSMKFIDEIVHDICDDVSQDASQDISEEPMEEEIGEEARSEQTEKKFEMGEIKEEKFDINNESNLTIHKNSIDENLKYTFGGVNEVENSLSGRRKQSKPERAEIDEGLQITFGGNFKKKSDPKLNFNETAFRNKLAVITEGGYANAFAKVDSGEEDEEERLVKSDKIINDMPEIINEIDNYKSHHIALQTSNRFVKNMKIDIGCQTDHAITGFKQKKKKKKKKKKKGREVKNFNIFYDKDSKKIEEDKLKETEKSKEIRKKSSSDLGFIKPTIQSTEIKLKSFTQVTKPLQQPAQIEIKKLLTTPPLSPTLNTGKPNPLRSFKEYQQTLPVIPDDNPQHKPIPIKSETLINYRTEARQINQKTNSRNKLIKSMRVNTNNQSNNCRYYINGKLIERSQYDNLMQSRRERSCKIERTPHRSISVERYKYENKKRDITPNPLRRDITPNVIRRDITPNIIRRDITPNQLRTTHNMATATSQISLISKQSHGSRQMTSWVNHSFRSNKIDMTKSDKFSNFGNSDFVPANNIVKGSRSNRQVINSKRSNLNFMPLKGNSNKYIKKKTGDSNRVFQKFFPK